MGERTSYAPGTPSWVDVSSPDIAASAAFYAGLFGWEHVDQGPDAGGYGMFRLRGKDVAGIGPVQGPPGTPPMWSVYCSVVDAGATLDAIRANGGGVLMGPMEVFDSGVMGVAT